MHCILIMGVILALANMSLYLTNNTAYCVLDLAYNCAIESGKKSFPRCGGDFQLFKPVLHSVKEMLAVIATCS